MRNLSRFAALLVVVWLPAAGWAETHAVLMGIDKYDNPDITPLRYTVNDVQAFYDLLVDPNYGGANPDNVVLMIPSSERGLRPTRAGILVQIKKAALRTQRDDTLILYFAGHGMETPDGRFLLGVDADPLLLSDTAVPVDRLPAILSDVRASKILVIVDACRNDPAAGRAQADNPLNESFERGLRPRILAPDGGGGPHQVATWLACGVGQRAWEFSQHEHGVFSYYLLEGLKGGAATDGEVGLQTLAEQVTKKVADWARRNGKEQDPKLDNPDDLHLILSRPKLQRPGGVQEIPLGTVHVESEPKGATVLIEGEPKGKTPCDVSLPLPGGENKKVTVVLQLEGYEPAAAGVELTVGQTQLWVKTLSKKVLPQVSAEQPALPQVSDESEQPSQPSIDHSARLPDWEDGPDGLPLVSIPGGEVTIGSDQAEEVAERPRHKVTLSAYKIQAVEVTNQAYAAMLNRLTGQGLCYPDGDGNAVTGNLGPGWPAGMVMVFSSSPDCGIKLLGPRGGGPEMMGGWTALPGKENLPVTTVTWVGAYVYAYASGMRLPTEAEWERAAQASDASQPYPWGGAKLTRMLANVETDDDDDEPALVVSTALRKGASAAGCLNMVGNVWEWTADRYVPEYHRLASGQDPLIGFQAGETVAMTMRGGGFEYPAELSSIYTRQGAYAGDYGADYGFRCVLPSQPTTNMILPSNKLRGGGGSSGKDELPPVASTYRHPMTGAVIALPEGWEAAPAGEAGAVLIEHDDLQAGIAYYFCSPIYNTPDLVHQALATELAQFVVLNQVVGNQILNLQTPNGPLQVFRREYLGTSGNGQLRLYADAVLHNGIYHGLVYLAAVDEFDADLPQYRAVLERTVYP